MALTSEPKRDPFKTYSAAEEIESRIERMQMDQRRAAAEAKKLRDQAKECDQEWSRLKTLITEYSALLAFVQDADSRMGEPSPKWDIRR